MEQAQREWRLVYMVSSDGLAGEHLPINLREGPFGKETPYIEYPLSEPLPIAEIAIGTHATVPGDLSDLVAIHCCKAPPLIRPSRVTVGAGTLDLLEWQL